MHPENERAITRVRGNAANGEATATRTVLWRRSSWASEVVSDVSAKVEFGRSKPSAHAYRSSKVRVLRWGYVYEVEKAM